MGFPHSGVLHGSPCDCTLHDIGLNCCRLMTETGLWRAFDEILRIAIGSGLSREAIDRAWGIARGDPARTSDGQTAASITCPCYGCAIRRQRDGGTAWVRSADPCEPPGACAGHGRCWTHSTWVDDGEPDPSAACGCGRPCCLARALIEAAEVAEQ